MPETGAGSVNQLISIIVNALHASVNNKRLHVTLSKIAQRLDLDGLRRHQNQLNLFRKIYATVQ